jgi:hypothetical protein
MKGGHTDRTPVKPLDNGGIFARNDNSFSVLIRILLDAKTNSNVKVHVPRLLLAYGMGNSACLKEHQVGSS